MPNRQPPDRRKPSISLAREVIELLDEYRATFRVPPSRARAAEHLIRVGYEAEKIDEPQGE